MSEESKRQAEQVVHRIWQTVGIDLLFKQEMIAVIAEALEKAWKQGFDDREMSERLSRILST